MEGHYVYGMFYAVKNQHKKSIEHHLIAKRICENIAPNILNDMERNLCSSYIHLGDFVNAYKTAEKLKFNYISPEELLSFMQASLRTGHINLAGKLLRDIDNIELNEDHAKVIKTSSEILNYLKQLDIVEEDIVEYFSDVENFMMKENYSNSQLDWLIFENVAWCTFIVNSNSETKEEKLFEFLASKTYKNNIDSKLFFGIEERMPDGG
jgi:hypothetical protein